MFTWTEDCRCCRNKSVEFFSINAHDEFFELAAKETNLPEMCCCLLLGSNQELVPSRYTVAGMEVFVGVLGNMSIVKTCHHFIDN
jgi:hypothetical protein